MVREQERRSRRGLLVAAGAASAALVGAVWWTSMHQPAAGYSRESAAGHSSGAMDDDLRLAAALAGVPEKSIRPSTGGIHVVYHVNGGVPTPAQPRADGKVTLLWFGATW